MKNRLGTLGTLLGLLGLIAVVAGIAGRFYGEPYFLGFRAINIVIVGIAFLSMACWAKLEAK